MTGYKLDCRFCHAYAGKSASAGIPSAAKCMMCHRVIATDLPETRKLAQYWKEQKPIPWIRVTDLLDKETHHVFGLCSPLHLGHAGMANPFPNHPRSATFVIA